MRKVDIVSVLILLALAAYVVVTANNFPLETRTLGPDFFPKLVAGCLAAFAIGILVMSFLRRKPEEAPTRPSRSLLISMVIMGLYIILLPYLGFLVATPAFLLAAGLLMAEEARAWWKKLCVSSIVTTGALYYLFGTLLNVPLP
jgi:putative tricarboxylic transport membrane protein